VLLFSRPHERWNAIDLISVYNDLAPLDLDPHLHLLACGLMRQMGRHLAAPAPASSRANHRFFFFPKITFQLSL
jgi:hypothetical protein